MSFSNSPKIEVAAAIISNENDEVLCMQRGLNKYSYISKKYEFPGGKIEPGETIENALIREIDEEINLDIEIDGLFLKVEHLYPDFFLIMHAYKCKTKSLNIVLNEHIAYKWLPFKSLNDLDWAAADIPIVKKLMIDAIK
tara:strand:- start:424 stop:843 length:420 start_codon:yes stop_codon:yes gene_type:complete